MLEIAPLTIEFDDLTRIAHLTGTKKVFISTQFDVSTFYNWLFGQLDVYSKEGRVYMVTNLGKLSFEPSLSKLYAAKSRHLLDKYIYPNGIARYGFEISRITVRHGFRDFLHLEPNIFTTRQEAFAYIYGLIRQNEKLHGRAAV